MRVFGWVADYAGCGYYRVQLPLRALGEAYDNISTAATGQLEIDEANSYDVIVGQRVHLPGPTQFWNGPLKDVKRIYEIDDNLWDVHKSSPAFATFSQMPIQARMAGNANVADAVTVSREPLADVLRKVNDEVYVLPNYIDEALLKWQRPRCDRVTVGWAGSATHQVDFMTAAASLRQFFSKYPHVDLHLITEVGYGRQVGDLVRKTVSILPWRPLVDDYHRSIDFDIGLAPLASNSFNDCKSAIKALEYAALGIPVVASDFGPYRDFVQHGVTGFLCRTERDWFRYLRMLVEDGELRETMGAAAKAQAAENTIQGHVDEWRQVYEKVLA